MEAISIGVIGAAGHMGRRFVNILKRHSGVSLIALADIDRQGLQALDAPPSVRRYADYGEMLERHRGLDAVVIATPDELHRAPCEAALRSGCHVLVEKPLADSIGDAEAIVRAGHAADRVLLVGHLVRFDPRYTQAFDAIVAGDVGEIVYMTARRNDFVRNAYRIKGRTSPLFFLGIHDLDVFHWFLQEKAVRVSGLKVSKHLRELNVEDAVLLRLEYASGAVAALEVSWLLPESMGKSDAQLEVVGREGALFIDAYFTGLRIHGSNGWKQPDNIYAPVIRGGVEGALRTEVDHFLDCIRGRTSPVITAEDAAAAVSVAVAALESAERGGIPVATGSD